MVIPALNFNLVRDERGHVPHDEGVPLDHVLHPLLLHAQPPVAHLVLKAGAVVLDGQQRLQQDKQEPEQCFNVDFLGRYLLTYLLTSQLMSI